MMDAVATSQDEITPLAPSERSFEAAPQTSDRELLQSYVQTGNAESFALLFQRHWPLVFGVACRRTGDAALAEDIAQAVFIVLAQKCPHLSPKTVLAGWLFRTTMFTANNALKAEVRRRQREEQAALDRNVEDPNPSRTWEVLSKYLDEGLASLPGADRDALLLRFMQDRSFGQIGEATGLNENAARQRVLRALEKLRRFLRKRRLMYSVGVISLAFGARPSSAPPPHALASQAAQSLAQQTLALLKWRRTRTILALSSVFLLAALAFGLFLSQRFQRNETLARRRLIQSVDMTFWLGDGPAFADLINFGKADPARARKAFAAYSTAYHLLRNSFHSEFGPATPDGLGSLWALSLLPEDKLKEQPTFNGRDHAVNQMVPGFSMHLVRDRGQWKWDLFQNATENGANRFLEKVESQTEVFTQLRGQIDRAEFNSIEKTISALQDELRMSKHGPTSSSRGTHEQN